LWTGPNKILIAFAESINDGGVWNRSKFGIDLKNERIDLPPPKNLYSYTFIQK